MWISLWIVFLMTVFGFSSIWSTASPSSVKNNKQVSRTLSKRNVYFETVEELLSQVSILQLRVKHIQTTLQELKESTAGGKKCPGHEASQMTSADCDANVLQELDTAMQNLREELGQEGSKSAELSKGFESLREEMEEYSYKMDGVEGICQKNSLKISDSTYDIENINITINEMESRFSKEVEGIKMCMKTTCGSTSKRAIGPPSYISQWFHMKAYDSKLSKITIEHGLNELPAKVDVQVKSISGTDYDWIFTGTSVCQADDDTGLDYGGVAYFYNEKQVILSVPTESNQNKRQGYIVTTGHRNDHFIGSHHYKYIEGLVRVRIWLLNTFPTPSYSSQWYSLDLTDPEKSFYAIGHGLSSYPAFVTVQVRSSSMISEASGSSLRYVGCCDAGGGVVYGVDDSMVRIWTAYIKNTTVAYGRYFGGDDGWAYSPGYDILGEFRVIVWDSESFDNVHLYTRQSNVMETQTGAFSMPEIDIDNDIVSLYAKALDGPNQGFLFNGWGSSQAVRVPFGGVIYAYNKQGQFQTWRPNPKKQGYLININSPYGNGRNIQSSNSASYVAKLLKAEE